MTLLIARHGETEKNALKQPHLLNDSASLTPKGFKQAELIEKFVKKLMRLLKVAKIPYL